MQGVIEITIPRWRIEEETGYKPFTNYWPELSISDALGEGSIRESFQEMFTEAKGDYKKLTELALVTNHKIWQHFKKGFEPDAPENAIARLYDELWRMVDDWACTSLKDKELGYYYEVTD